MRLLISLCILGSALSYPQYQAPGEAGKGAPIQQVKGEVPHGTSTCQLGNSCISWNRCAEGFIQPAESPLLEIKPSNFDALKCGEELMCCGLPDGLLGILQPQTEKKPFGVKQVKEPVKVPVEGERSYTSPIARTCGHSSYDCVPFYQCKDGVINTDGAGLIDVRVRPQANCYSPEYPDDPTICCLIPGAYPTPAPIEKCPGYQECVDFSHCSADGTVNTDGSGLIDIRTGYTSCYLPSGNGGRCCTPPPPYVDDCPSNSVCLPGPSCSGRALDALDSFIDYSTSGLWTHCGPERTGVCCIPPVLDNCPGESFCVEGSKCLGRALNALNAFVDYSNQGHWTHCSGYSKGVCCIPPVLDNCPGESVCVEGSKCTGSALNALNAFVDYSNQGHWTHCSGYSKGVCCIQPEPIYKPSDKCGVRNYKLDQRITSNYQPNEAHFGEFPWQAIVFYQNYTFVCGASLISHKHVLTAAHCVHKLFADDIRIRFGEWQVNSFDGVEANFPYIDKNVKAISIHPSFNQKNLQNDFAVLELVEPLDFNYHINTVCVPSYGQVFPPDTRCFVTGWGKDSFTGNFQHILKKVDVPYVDKPTCQSLLRNTRLGKYFRLDSSFMCAGGEANKDACYGDGGGPLVCKDPQTGQYVQVGITAWGIGCGVEGNPGVYADVQEASNWIETTVLGHGGASSNPVKGYGK